MTADDLMKIKTAVEKARANAAEAKGRADQCVEQLKSQYGVSTAEEARSLLERMREEATSLAKQASEAESNLHKNWGSQLEQLGIRLQPASSYQQS